MSYPELQDIRTKKAPEHQRVALKNKGNDISNAEVVSIKESIEPDKFSSPEKFIEAHGKTYIHQTYEHFDEFDMSKVGSGQGEQWHGIGIYFQEKGTFKIEYYGNVEIEAFLLPEAKIFYEIDGELLQYAIEKGILTERLSNKIATYTEDTLPDPYILSKNPDGTYLVMEQVTMPSGDTYWTGLTYVPQRSAEASLKDAYNKLHGIEEYGNITTRDLFAETYVEQTLKDDGYDGVYIDGELVIYNLDAIRTKAQLTKVWNDALTAR